MSHTRRELVDQALRDLGFLPANATPSASDVATVDAKVDGVLGRLTRMGIVDVPDDEEIDPDIFHPIAIFLADACKSEFGGATLDLVAAEHTLRRVTAAGPDYSAKSGEFY